MAKRKKNVWLTILKVVVILAMLVCVALDGWFVYIKYFAPEKIISETNKVEDVVLADGTSKNMIEINYYTNENKNGLEMFEIKFNYLLDETRTAFYSQGVQYVAESEDSTIGWEYYVDDTKSADLLESDYTLWVATDRVFGQWGYFEPLNAGRYNYQSSDDYQTVSIATNPIDENSMLKITMGEAGNEKIYGINLKHENVEMLINGEINQKLYIKSGKWVTWNPDLLTLFLPRDQHYYYFSYADVNYFARCLYESIQCVTPGTNSAIVFEFADLFDYYECENEAAGKYSSTALNSDALSFDVKNYFGIQINVSADGARYASDSMFNCVQGNSTFNLTGDYFSEDYFYGETVIDCDIYDFELVNATENYYYLKLSDEFVNYYSGYAKSVCLNVEIDLDILNANNIEFLGFTADSGLENFKVTECYTVETIDGEVVKTEVAYEQ